MNRIAGLFHPFCHPSLNERHVQIEKEMLANISSLYQTTASFQHLTIKVSESIYNYDELRQRLRSHNVDVRHLTHSEILLRLFHYYGEKFASLLQGNFAIAITDTFHQKLYLFRDPIGVQPLFYTYTKETFLYCSYIKGLLAYPNLKLSLSLEGLRELLALGPAHVPGHTLYQDIYEVEPGHCLIFSKQHLSSSPFWTLEAKPHQETYEETIEHAGYLLKNCIHRQMLSLPEASCFLSGGLDSSLVAAMVDKEKKAANIKEPLETFSFDFSQSQSFFHANDYQPSLDKPYVITMTNHLNTHHHFLECSTLHQTALLQDAVTACDGPCMADITSSLLHFCRLSAPFTKTVFTGECADEIFAGYPWYHKDNDTTLSGFPWSHIPPRKALLSQEVVQKLSLEDYEQTVFYNELTKVPCLEKDSPAQQLHRQKFVLTIRYFMQTLLDRMDRCAWASGLSALVPFADLSLVTYLYNVPFEWKSKNHEPKHLLREIAKPYLPPEIVTRKKSPYPKNYNPNYEQLLIHQLKQRLKDANSPLLSLLDLSKTFDYFEQPTNYSNPWYGQLMAGPQLLAYYLQIDDWIVRYHINLPF